MDSKLIPVLRQSRSRNRSSEKQTFPIPIVMFEKKSKDWPWHSVRYALMTVVA
jgi:hypothetical protein